MSTTGFTEREAWLHDQWLTPPEDEAPVCCVCSICGEDIREGEDVYEFGEHNICQECMEYAHTYAKVC